MASVIGVKPPTVSQWTKGKRPVPPRRCTAIEKATGGIISRRDLRPNDWGSLWPELAYLEENPAAAPAQQAQAAIKTVAQGAAT